ncbi:ABC transporter permease [Thermus tengchongensis]|uniref:Transport permease protein n=1 Tax=Thermus tengchongensis TaxID=1214928 RepID=A0A4Y9FFL0_9DEIN|nr:ABC transporter permease [Thermus tengchongensis]TFU27682.1 ABC transporter permease [Thermus tengchongensis]
MNRILALAEKEFLQIRRDHVLPRLIVLLPSLMLLLFGYAINFTLKGIPLAVHDASQDRVSQTLLQELTREDRFHLALQAKTPEEVVRAVDRGQARVGLVVPAGALEKVRRGESLSLEVYVDGTDPNFAFQAQAALRKAIQEVNARILLGRALAGESVLPPLSPSLHTLYNPENKTAWFMIPGIIGLVLTMFTVLLTALSIVREAESRMMESLLASPLRPHEMVLGKVLPYLFIAFGVALLVLALGHWVFGVPVRGSLALLLLAMFLFVLGSLAAGVLISTLARTQVQAVFGTYAYAFPTIFLSGFVFPIDSMPRLFQLLSYLVPARYLIEVLRGVMLKGVGLGVLWPHLLALALFSGLVLFLASARFQRQVAV